eukprot:TRINITY_DN782215_c0_g1_i1.p1 TRINITY_DN782215_c0_g1~~TRINITY_DN782215_c0_g1_i1.p1  ORF type:complete len:293 (-),score=76.60 TRINITY_DN782215_c0_g1_i1:145-1023(-)
MFQYLKGKAHILKSRLLGGKSLCNELAVITGAGSGIGALTAKKLASQGCKLALLDVNESVHKVREEIKEKFPDLEVVSFVNDVTDKEAVYKVMKEIEKELGAIDLLFNNAGIVTGKKLLDCPDALIEKTFEVNALAHYWTTKAVLPGMLERDHGHIITISSASGIVGVSGLCDYAASKFAAIGFDESLRFELKKMGSNVQTTCVCPFYINTGMFDGVKTRFPSVLPILEPTYVANKIVKAVRTNKRVLMMPRFVYTTTFIRSFLPTNVFDDVVCFFGINDSMDKFKGHSDDQ